MYCIITLSLYIQVDKIWGTFFLYFNSSCDNNVDTSHPLICLSKLPFCWAFLLLTFFFNCIFFHEASLLSLCRAVVPLWLKKRLEHTWISFEYGNSLHSDINSSLQGQIGVSAIWQFFRRDEIRLEILFFSIVLIVLLSF